MPSDSSGNYSLPSGYLAVTGQTILAAQHNSPLEDLAAGETARLMRSGAGGMTGTLKVIDGTAPIPGLAFSTAGTTGLFKTTDGNIGLTVNGTQVGVVNTGGFQLNPVQVSYQYFQRPSAPGRVLGSSATASKAITSAANNGSGLIRLTVADTSDLTTGQSKLVTGVTGTKEANGQWTITVVDATHVDLQGSAYANAYINGGTFGGGVEELTLGSGLSIIGNTLGASTAPVPGSFKNLSIKVASNTTVAVAADFIVLTDGTNSIAKPIAATVNLGTAGVVNALDAGTIAIDTWYAVWAIYKTDLTSGGCIVSTSATAPTMPTGYTYKVRIGWVRTAHATATLYGTWQIGRNVQYVLGLAQTTILPLIASGITGTYSDITPSYATQSIVNFVPSTASKISLVAANAYQNFTLCRFAIAPNTSYGGLASIKPPLIGVGNTLNFYTSLSVEMVLEGTTVAITSDNAGFGLMCRGWEDNI